MVGNLMDGRKWATDARGARAVRPGAESRVRREPAAAATCLAWRSVSGGGRAPRAVPAAHPRDRTGRPASVRRRRRAPGRMAEQHRPEDGAGERYRGVGASSSRRRGPRWPERSFDGPRFSGKEPELLARFSRKGPWVPKNKNPLPGGSGLRMRVLSAPQFFHFPCAAAARFVVVTWVICQEATACRRTKARGQPIWEAGADMVCCVQFMEFVIARSVPAMCGR